MKICSKQMIISEAITIRLFDQSIWANLGNGLFVDRETTRTQSIHQLYRNIRTVIRSGGVVFAKRKRPSDSLNCLTHPYKAKRW